MGSVSLVGAVAVTAALTLTACVAEPPRGPTQAEREAFSQRVLDATWQGTGLDGVIDRPATPDGEPLADAVWVNEVFDCMQSNGIGSGGLGSAGGLQFTLYDDGGAIESDPAAQYVFYECIAAHPRISDKELLSEPQLDYVYDYYAEWLVPCMQREGYELDDAPTRADFHSSYGQWSPYWRVPVTRDGTELDDLEKACGPELPPLSTK